MALFSDLSQNMEEHHLRYHYPRPVPYRRSSLSPRKVTSPRSSLWSRERSAHPPLAIPFLLKPRARRALFSCQACHRQYWERARGLEEGEFLQQEQRERMLPCHTKGHMVHFHCILIPRHHNSSATSAI
jgi:hypothetical protein